MGTVTGFKEILEGKHDHLPEQAFYMVGTIDEALEKIEPDKKARLEYYREEGYLAPENWWQQQQQWRY